jgi:hypothetical protein
MELVHWYHSDIQVIQIIHMHILHGFVSSILIRTYLYGKIVWEENIAFYLPEHNNRHVKLSNVIKWIFQ